MDYPGRRLRVSAPYANDPSWSRVIDAKKFWAQLDLAGRFHLNHRGVKMSGIPAGAVTVGSKLYMFHAAGSKECLISAHGGYYKENRTFKVPQNVNVNFYAPAKHILQDPGIGIMAQKLSGYVIDSMVAGQDCINYILSKYQGKHGDDKETYASIRETIANIEDKQREIRNKLSSGPISAVRKKNLELTMELYNTMNVVTIRNRFSGADVNLSEVIQTIRKHRPHITTFHCSFCRALIGEPNSPSHKIGEMVA